MKTTSRKSYFYGTQSKMVKNSKKIVKVKGFVERKFINTLTPKFSYKNHVGEIISPEMDNTL